MPLRLRIVVDLECMPGCLIVVHSPDFQSGEPRSPKRESQQQGNGQAAQRMPPETPDGRHHNFQRKPKTASDSAEHYPDPWNR